MNKQQKFLIVLITISVFFICFSRPLQAQSHEEIIWQQLKPENIASQADDLIQKLDTEISKIIAAGHLAPFRVLYGEITIHYYWYRRGDMVLTLARAYPYVSVERQAEIRNYVRSEMSNYPLWIDQVLDMSGTKRQPDELDNWGVPPNRGTKLWQLYGLWLYAANSGDWALVNDNWPAIKNFYNQNRSEASQHYSAIAGAIGMARMAQYQGDSISATAVNDALTGMNNGQDFLSFSQNSEDAFQWGINWDSWYRRHLYLGWQFLNISPEVGRYLNSHSGLRAQVLGEDPAAVTYIYSTAYGQAYFPLWFMAQGPMFSRYFGEGSGMPPDTKGMIFPIKAWVEKLPPDQLRYYVDVGDALIGDCYFLQNLLTVIEHYGQICWQDIRTGSQVCESGPTELPTPTYLQGDVNHSGEVDTHDVDLILANFSASFTSGYYDAEAEFDNRINGLDFGWVINNLTK